MRQAENAIPYVECGLGGDSIVIAVRKQVSLFIERTWSACWSKGKLLPEKKLEIFGLCNWT